MKAKELFGNIYEEVEDNSSGRVPLYTSSFEQISEYWANVYV